MSTSELSSSGIRVSLCNVNTWEKFYPNNEMIVTKLGRRLFPALEVDIEGLEKDALYTVSIYLERVNNVKYEFEKNEQTGNGEWTKGWKYKSSASSEKRLHKDGGMIGAHWMKAPVSFSYINITSNENNTKQGAPIYVDSMYKYQPVVTVKRLDNGCEEEFRLTMTEFIPVSSYHSPKLSELKTKNIKRNIGNRSESQENKRGRKRAITSDDTSPSAVLSPTKKVTPVSKNPMNFQNQVIAPSTIPAITPMASHPTIPPSGGLSNGQNQMMAPSSMTPSTMVTPPSLASISIITQIGGHNNFHNQFMTPSTLVTPLSVASTHTIPPSCEPTDFQNTMITPQTVTPSNMISYPTHDVALNQHHSPYGTWNIFQMAGTPMPPPKQWDTLPGSNHAQDFNQFENTGNMQQMNPNFQQYNNYNRAGSSSQQFPSGANFDFRYQ